MSLLKITMLKDWVGWLKAGEHHELDCNLAHLLVGLRKADWDYENLLEIFDAWESGNIDKEVIEEFPEFFGQTK